MLSRLRWICSSGADSVAEGWCAAVFVFFETMVYIHKPLGFIHSSLDWYHDDETATGRLLDV